ncbi:MAG: pyruvate formate-lyase [Clostridia bacterium]|nr:pyruvate formate-lyase [Clostridia bacterium]
MTERIARILDYLNQREYRKLRQEKPEGFVRATCVKEQVKVFKEIVDSEKPLLFLEDTLGFNRYTGCVMPQAEGNLTPNYARVIQKGFDAIVEEIKVSMQKTEDPEKLAYGQGMLGYIELCLNLVEKYQELAKQECPKLYEALLKVPHKGAETFYEACVFMKMCIYFLRLCGVTHLTLGRFDQYMYPFYQRDKAAGKSDEEILELIEEFFISINYDSDLYHGVQQGDNGQSMVLGGFDKDGSSMYNALSKLCMQASLELSVIDPKINLRVGKNTPDEVYEYATLLTKQGLGFPQYCNDDVVVPGLIKLGYAPEDAFDYTVAACWEYIVPNCGADYPNITTMDFPHLVYDVMKENLLDCDSFEELMALTEAAIGKECDRLTEEYNHTQVLPQAFLSIFMDGCIESLTDLWAGGTKYNNFGCHGAGIANGADALAAVKKIVFEDKAVTKEELLSALDADFEGYAKVRNLLKSCPKMGNNEDEVDDIAAKMMDAFQKGINHRDNQHGGIWRAGTGSAMEYLWKGEQCPATADGRGAGEPYSSSFSPSLDVKTDGLLSVIQSFTKYDMTHIINGGPLTIEIHDTVLRNEMGVKKTAQLVKQFILLGGHQLQLNAINRDRLLDAQDHPEKYPNLIVRVWGWSGYFNELDVAYQNHIIRRLEYLV